MVIANNPCKREMAMSGFVSGSRFGIKVGLRVAIFVGLTVGFPFIVYGLILATNARSVGGASGALAAVAGIYLKPIIIVAFLTSLIAPCWRRMRSLGLSAFWGLLVPFLFLMDGTYLLVASAHWGTAFALGILAVSAPLFAMTALAMLVAMAFASRPSDDIASNELFRGIGWVCAVLAVLLVAIALSTSDMVSWFKLMIAVRSPGGQFSPSLLPTKAAYYAQLLKPLVCTAFCAAMMAITVLSRRQGSGNISGGNQPGGDPVKRSPPSAPINTAGAAFGKR
jgi:hypothetical protein